MEYKKLIEHTLGGMLSCIGCQKYILSFNDLNMYEHSGGIKVPGKDELQWVYLTCPKCQYQSAWWKLLRKV